MALHLDRVSRATVVRFTVKVGVSIFLASLSTGGHLRAAATWLVLYAAFTAVLAVLLRERIEERSFNHLDEMSWLAGASQALEIAHKAMG